MTLFMCLQTCFMSVVPSVLFMSTEALHVCLQTVLCPPSPSVLPLSAQRGSVVVAELTEIAGADSGSQDLPTAAVFPPCFAHYTAYAAQVFSGCLIAQVQNPAQVSFQAQLMWR